MKANIVKDITHRIRVSGLRLSEAAILLDTPQSDLLLALAGKFQSFRAENCAPGGIGSAILCSDHRRAPVVHETKRMLFDSAGVAFAAQAIDMVACARTFRSDLAASEVTVLGSRGKVSASNAALANGERIIIIPGGHDRKTLSTLHSRINSARKSQLAFLICQPQGSLVFKSWRLVAF
ncbi:hypothetical protein ACTMU2_16030 [Cupriavidus basilensis]